MDKVQEISSRLYLLYQKFYNKKKTRASWDAFIAQCKEVANNYQEPEKSFAEYMALAFMGYIEEKEKQKGI